MVSGMIKFILIAPLPFFLLGTPVTQEPGLNILEAGTCISQLGCLARLERVQKFTQQKLLGFRKCGFSAGSAAGSLG